MEIKRSCSHPSEKGPADYFTGAVRIDPVFNPPTPAACFRCRCHLRARGSYGMAHTSARSDLDVTAGCGQAQGWGGMIEAIRPGDVVWIPPGEKHWHGATPTAARTHIAIQEQL